VDSNHDRAFRAQHPAGLNEEECHA